MSPKRKQNPVQQSNGIISLSTIMARLELFNESQIKDKNVSLTLKLGKQVYESAVLQKPGT
jgi:hypothetical protein